MSKIYPHPYPEELAAIRKLATETHFYTDERRDVYDARLYVKDGRLPEATILLEGVERRLQEKLTAVRVLCRKTAEAITGEEDGR